MLRGVDEYRIVTFAALLIIMMIVRPAGILPSSRRRIQVSSNGDQDLPNDPEELEDRLNESRVVAAGQQSITHDEEAI